MKVVLLATDLRESFRAYTDTTPRLPGGTASLLDGFARLPEVELHVISCLQRPVQSPEKLADNIWFHGLLVPKLGWLRTGYLGCVRAVRRKLREIQPDIVQGDGTERDCGISAVFSGYPNVVAMQGNMAELARLNRPRIGSYGWLTARLENFVLPRTAGVFCNSTYTEKLVRPRARKTWLMPHPLRQSFLDPAPDAGPRPCVLLNVGAISPRKRQLELLDVAEALHRQGLKFEFHFIGYIHSLEIAYTTAFQKRVRPMAEAGYARFLGTPAENELLHYYDSAAAMVHFPTEDAAPMVVLEGLGRDLKFFGARLGGIVEMAQDMPGAELFAPDDWAGLTAAIARWIAQGHPRPVGGAAIIRKRRLPEALARRHVEIYREVIAEKKAKD
ncbi:MAG: glycosyltransferase family 4 protein [Verrucomicrobiota bacterium]